MSFAQPKSLTELVTEELRQKIVSGQLDLGSAISEASMAKELNVSRTPVREAINRLENEGLLKILPRRGTFVFCLGKDELAKICDVRVCLETAALQFSMAHDRAVFFSALEKCTDAMTLAREAGRDDAYLILDTAFHQCLFDHSDNRLLLDAYNAISSKMAALRNRLGGHPEHMEKSYREHVEIKELIGKNDLESALQVLTAHIDHKEGSYWQLATD